jgi:hypothetical protein
VLLTLTLNKYSRVIIDQAKKNIEYHLSLQTI